MSPSPTWHAKGSHFALKAIASLAIGLSATVLATLASLCLLVVVIVWAVWINPINCQFVDARSLPSNWADFRDSWHSLARSNLCCLQPLSVRPSVHCSHENESTRPRRSRAFSFSNVAVLRSVTEGG